MKHYQTQQGVELTQYKLIKHFYTHLNTSNLRPERAKLTIRVQQTSNEFKSFHWNGTSVEIFLQLMENVFGIIRNSEFVDWFFFTPWIKYCWCYRDGIWLNSGLRPDVSLTPATYDGIHLTISTIFLFYKGEERFWCAYRVGWDKYSSRQGFHFNTPDCDTAPAAVCYIESFFYGSV